MKLKQISTTVLFCWTLPLFAAKNTSPTTNKENSRQIVIAHRGASSYLPEHTLAGFAMAHAAGADYLEPDVVITKDGHPIVLHDIYMESTTDVEQKFPERAREDGRWYAIDFTLEEVKSLRVHERTNKHDEAYFPKRFPKQLLLFQVPSLEEFIQLVQGLNKSTGKNTGIYPEIKAPRFHQNEGKDSAKIVLNVLGKYGYTDSSQPIFLQCFDPNTLKRIKYKLKSKLPLVQLIASRDDKENGILYSQMHTQEGLKKISEYATGIGIGYNKIIRDLGNGQKEGTQVINQAHEVGLLVHIYTLRADRLPSYAKNFAELVKELYTNEKIDGAFTDFTDQTIKALKALKAP
jgi:glycerophosphoryl diester phosphodiesterase